MKKYIFVCVCLLCTINGFSQAAIDSVKSTISKLFTAMKTSDGVMLAGCFADSAVLQTIAKDKAGNVVVRNEQIPEFAKQIAKLTKGDADERITFDVVKVDADLATAWTPYQFYFKGKFSHCGVNSFQLVRIKGEWKIQYIIDTRRIENCG